MSRNDGDQDFVVIMNFSNKPICIDVKKGGYSLITGIAEGGKYFATHED